MAVNEGLSDPKDDEALENGEEASEDAFDEAFADFASSKDEPPADAAGHDDDDPEDKDKSDDPLPGDLPGGESDEAAANKAPAEDQSEDIWKDAPEPLRKAFEDLRRDSEYKLSSVKGRLSAADRKMMELQDALANSQKPDPQESEGGENPSEAKQGSSWLDSDDIKRLREDYGEVAGPLIDQIAQLSEKLEAVQAPVNQLNQQQQQEARAAQYDILAEHHPDFKELSQDERWGGWIQTQPRHVQEAYMRNIDVSDGLEAADVLTRCKQDMGIALTPAAKQEQQQQRKPVSDKRQRQLDAARDGGSGGSDPVQNAVPDDFDKAFDVVANKIDKKRANPSHRL